MVFTPQEIELRLERILPGVQKPARYTGGEINQVVKDWDSVRSHVALIFPDLYDLGMSNLGWAILYDELNQRPDTLAERAFAPWSDMEAALRQQDIPLYSLETKHPLSQFDILGFSLPYETLYTNTLNILDLAGIPLFSAERTERHPLVIAGGHSTYNPEPMHAFIDAFVIGEGEDVIHEIVDAQQAWKASGAPRGELLRALAGIWGVYVPALYEAHYNPDGTFSDLVRLDETAPLPVMKRIDARLPAHHPLARPLYRHGPQPRPDRDHARLHPRLPLLPRRDDHPPGARAAGGRDPGGHRRGHRRNRLRGSGPALAVLLGLYEYSGAGQGSQRALRRQAPLRFAALPAHRELLGRSDGCSAGFAPLRLHPGARSRHRAHARDHQQAGFHPAAAGYRRRDLPARLDNLKLYFMIGHPSETLEDVQAIGDLCKQVLAVGRKYAGKRAKVTAGVSTFVPKPHTPFQWVACDTVEQIRPSRICSNEPCAATA